MLMKEYSIAERKNRRFLLIACEVLHKELLYCASRSKNVIDIEFCSQGYHDLESCEMSRRLQDRIDSSKGKGYDAILLGFALCSNGVLGLKAADVPLVIPRAHDCISILLGGRDRYARMFEECPGTYYLSSGWIERDSGNLEDLRKISLMHKLGMDKSFDELKAEFGEENAQYIYDTLTGAFEENYKRIVFINNGLGDVESYREISRREAEKRSLEFIEVEGSLDYVQSLVDGNWNENDFLVLEKGGIICRGDEVSIIRCEYNQSEAVEKK